MPINYLELIDYLGSQYEEIEGYQFYNEIFPNNERSGEMCSDFSKPNAIYLYTDEQDKGTQRRMRRRIMLQDTWEHDYMDYVEQNESTLCSGLAYRSRSNKLQHAQQCNALIIDLDGVGFKEIRNLFLRFGKSAEKLRTLPMPTYLVVSGKGLHVYYVLDKPLELFPNIKVQLKSLKYDLTFRMWEYKSTSQFKNIQYQSINQGFRMVGSINKKYGCQIRAYRIGDKVSIEYLNQYVKHPVDVTQRFRPSSMTKEEAKLKFPEWYAKVFDENGNKRKNIKLSKWDIKGKVHGSDPYALYHWWMRKADEVKGGHRYFFLMCMSIYASKCDVPLNKLKEDMKEVYETLKEVEHDNPLKKEDIDSALEMYSKEFWNFKIEDISKVTDIPIERNKRNGRKRVEHLQADILLRADGKPQANSCKQNREIILSYMRENGEIKGRPKGSDKSKIVREWRLENPDGKKIDCHKKLGLSRVTINKWWDFKEE